MSKAEIEKSFQILKGTVPLLLKHNISAIPTNYALWYTYVSNDSEQLKQEIDESINKGYPLSALKSKDLYRHYLSEKQEVDAWQLRQSIEAMILEVSSSMQDTQADTTQFKNVMDASLDNLAKVEREGLTVSEVMTLVRSMVKDRRSGVVLGDVTVSIGVSQKAEKESSSELVARADELLYKAKNLGRNRVMPIA
jgi:diguanylate cyclase